MSFEGINVLHRAGNIFYGIMESSSSVDKLKIDINHHNSVGFNYFHNKFGMPYNFLLKSSIDSGHPLFVAIKDSCQLLGFARFEKISDEVERTHKGKRTTVHNSYHVLRSIEVHPAQRSVGIGRLLCSIAVKHLKSNVVTLPDNPQAMKFFKDRLKFNMINANNNSLSSRYSDYLILPYPRAKDLLKIIAGDYPRLVMPELIDRYEALVFSYNMGKSVSKKDIDDFRSLFEASKELINNKLIDDIESFIDNVDSIH